MNQIIWSRVKSFQSILMILITLGYLLGTHLSTINSLKMALVSKAERSEVDMLDKKLTRIEVKLEEALISKQEIFNLHQRLERKLNELAVEMQRSSERAENAGK
ncbi:MAG: hypothetical protein V3V99_09415 [candidate division Zixibacteria bacterium]